MSEPRVVACTKCRVRFKAKRRTTFLGFGRFECPSCGGEILHPLRPATRGIYWALLALAGVFIVIALAQGEVPIPGVLLFAVGYALYRDYFLTDQLRRVERSLAAKRPRTRRTKSEQPDRRSTEPGSVLPPSSQSPRM